jgi:hypothetical protein
MFLDTKNYVLEDDNRNLVRKRLIFQLSSLENSSSLKSSFLSLFRSAKIS